MRIESLDLIRYGRFTDARVELPRAEPDIHFVVGPNEAGKSTAMAALEDLLFGIPSRTTLDFVHSYRDMRIGGTLESNGSRLLVRRRKGTKNTLLSAEDAPLDAGERALAPFLGSTGRDRFERLFSLDHERLRRGGREILEAKGDIGEALFTAGTGFQQLRGLRRELEEDAEGLWHKRRSAKRKYFAAEDRLKQAESDLRDSTVTASKWRELKRKHEDCKETYNELARQIQALDAEQRKLGRIRRVARFIQEKASLEGQIEALGHVAEIPADAAERLQDAELKHTKATQGIDDQAGELNRTREERAALHWDDALLRRGEEIERLHERRIQVQSGRQDLPKREAELAAAEEELQSLAEELGWESADSEALAARIPSRSAASGVRGLLGRRTERLAVVKSAQSALSEAEARHDDTRRGLDAIGDPPDISMLSAVIKSVTRESGDVPALIRSAKSELEDAKAKAEQLFRQLRPQPGTGAGTRSMAVPSPQDVRRHRDARAALDRRIDACKDRVRSAMKELDERRAARARIEADEQPVTRSQVTALRGSRDEGWQLVRRVYVRGENVPAEEVRRVVGDQDDLPAAYEAAVVEADNAADRNLSTAEAVAALREVDRLIEAQQRAIEASGGKARDLARESAALDAGWLEMWSASGVQPLAPDAMLGWLDTYGRRCEALERQAKWERQIEALCRQESEAIASVRSELGTLGVDVNALSGHGLQAILARAAQEEQGYLRIADARSGLEDALRKARVEVQSKRSALARAEAAAAAWRVQWAEAVGKIGLPSSAQPESVEAQIEVIDRMRDVRTKIHDLKTRRIELIRRDISQFERQVRSVAGALDARLLDRHPDDATVELERRLELATDARNAAREKDKEIGRLEKKIGEYGEQAREATEAIAALQKLAGVATKEGLRNAIERAETHGSCQSKLNDIRRALEKDGDGYSVPELEAECGGQDLDRAGSRQDALATEIEGLRKRQLEARAKLNEAKTEFNAVGGSDAAALAEGARQNALAEIGEIAEQYVRARSAALLLQWAIERNRREKQAPMLRRASALFRELTLGSFEALEVDFDEQDEPRLVGRRPSGERVGADGMSDGSADQLYLAIRVAGLEDHVENGEPLPFVADDLFINFDDRRAAAGLRVLDRLAQRCQVIFFTHHEHLVEIARQTLGSAVRVWPMGT